MAKTISGPTPVGMMQSIGNISPVEGATNYFKDWGWKRYLMDTAPILGPYAPIARWGINTAYSI